MVRKATKKLVRKHKKVHVHTPVWATRLYVSLAVILIPWTGYLSVSLPERYVSHHWDLSWVGLNVAIASGLLMTGLLAYHKSRWVVIAAVFTGTVLLVDAWFDVVSERPGRDFVEAICMALCIEIPLAIISFVLAARTLNHNID